MRQIFVKRFGSQPAQTIVACLGIPMLVAAAAMYLVAAGFSSSFWVLYHGNWVRRLEAGAIRTARL